MSVLRRLAQIGKKTRGKALPHLTSPYKGEEYKRTMGNGHWAMGNEKQALGTRHWAMGKGARHEFTRPENFPSFVRRGWGGRTNLYPTSPPLAKGRNQHHDALVTGQLVTGYGIGHWAIWNGQWTVGNSKHDHDSLNPMPNA